MYKNIKNFILVETKQGRVKLEMNNFANLRNQKKISQGEVAKLLNITQASYNRYEAGINEPNIEKLIKLADYYNVSIDYLVGRDTSNDIGYLNEQETQLVKIFRELKQNSQYKVIGYAMAELEK